MGLDSARSAGCVENALAGLSPHADVAEQDVQRQIVSCEQKSPIALDCLVVK